MLGAPTSYMLLWFSFLNVHVHEGIELMQGSVHRDDLAPHLSPVFDGSSVHVPILELEQVCDSGG